MTAVEVTEEDLDYIDQILLSIINDDSIFCVSQLDGFLTGLVSGPEMILPSEWFSVLWGGNDNAPAWETQDEAMHFFGLLFTMMNNNSQLLTEDPDNFEPMVLMDIELGKTIAVITNWCDGYMRAVNMRESLWANLPSDIQEHLDVINILGTDFDLERLHSLSKDERDELEDQVAPAARALHAYWLQHRVHDRPSDELLSNMMPSMGAPADFPRSAQVLPFVREQSKIGRNDPCPCGSGKKYKKCCGLS